MFHGAIAYENKGEIMSQQTSSIAIDNKMDRTVEMVRQLSLRDRLRLIAVITPEIEMELPNDTAGQELKLNRESLYGLWKNFQIDLKNEDIDEARSEVWRNFPRTDII